MTNKIIFNLNDDRDAYVVSKPSHIVHTHALDQLAHHIRESLSLANKYAKEVGDAEISTQKRIRRHDTIMLAGVRGSGKTTFMLSLLHYIDKKCDGAEAYHFGGEILSLGILDPTLIEDKTHIFINIISMIKDKVDQKAKKNNCFQQDSSESCHDYQAWEKSFRSLAEGLPAIDGLGGNGFDSDTWLDPQFVMDKGVRMAHAANRLELSFHEFVHKSLKFLGKSAFILCFDDIDTSFNRGWPVLEVLHKYLTTPQMISILSGDPTLYSILIKDRQWANFSERLVKVEASDRYGRQKLSEIIAHLEEQYFLKLLKSERRIFLSSLYEKELQRNDVTVIENDESLSVDKNGVPLRKKYREIFVAYGIQRTGDHEAFYRFLASCPLRTQKQLLFTSKSDKHDFGRSLIDIFWTDLLEKKVDASSLRNIPHYTIPQAVAYLVKNRILAEGNTFIPLFSDHFINGAQIALGVLMSELIKNDPAQIFEFWLRVCLTRELGALMDQATNKRNEPSIDDYIEHCSITKLRATRYVARVSTAYIRACLGKFSEKKILEIKVSEDKGAWHGTLPLKGLAERARKPNTTDRIDAVFEEKDGFLKVMAYLPLSGYTNHKGQSKPIYSFYNLLGVLGEMLAVIQTFDEIKEDNEKHVREVKLENMRNEVRKIIARNAQYREYPLPSWASPLGDSSDNESDLVDNDEPDSKLIEQVDSSFTADMVTWIISYQKVQVVSPALLAKIFTRFYYSINKMDSKLAKSDELGNWMHRLTVVFLNSVLLVEAMEFDLMASNEKDKKDAISIKLTNPTSHDDNFINNIKAVNGNSEAAKLSFSKWMLASPLWKFYLKSDFDCNASDGWEQLTSFTNIDTKVATYQYGLNAKLDLITINIAGKDKAAADGLPSLSLDDSDHKSNVIALITGLSGDKRSELLNSKGQRRAAPFKNLFKGIYADRSINAKIVDCILALPEIMEIRERRES